MKKVKIMLLSLFVLAAVGGALAFKARFVSELCTSLANGNGQCPVGKTCPTLTADATTAIDQNPQSTFCYTVARAGAAPGFACRTANNSNAAFLPCQPTGVQIVKNN